MESTEQRFADILNLGRYEARLYVAALRVGQANLTELARIAGIARTAAYPPLQSLVRRGLMSAVRIRKRRQYTALQPRQLEHVLDQKKADLKQIISEFSQQILATPQKLSIQYFVGSDGIGMASDIFLADTKTKLWKTFEHPIYTAELRGTRRVDEYVERRVAKGIWARVIFPAPMKSAWIQEHLAHDREELRETIIVSPDTYPLEASIAATEGMVLLIAAKTNQFAALVKNDELAKTVSSIHDIAWDRYKI